MGASIFQAESGKKYLFPFIIIASLFFLSGYTNALLDVLNKYFQEVLHISRAESDITENQHLIIVLGGQYGPDCSSGALMVKNSTLPM